MSAISPRPRGFPSRSIWVVLLGLALALFAAPPPAKAQEGGAIFADPSRIVAIGGSITEIVYALGEEGRLIARDSTSTYPEAALKLPDVGYMRALSPEGVLSVSPTGILALAGSGPAEAIDVLKKASVTFITVPETFNHEGILEKIRIVGKSLGADAAAEKLAASVDADLAAAEKLTANVPERKRVLFLLSVQGGKLLAAGADTAADGIIRLAGGINAVEGFSGYKQLSDEAALTARPDLVLMMDRGDDQAAAADLWNHPGLAGTPAAATKKLVLMDGGYLLGFGPRTAGAVRDLATALYGDQLRN
ncbi:hemin ABC transporter substrate-binding protein [Pseudaminobacter arsenicus]|uniref:Hemin ABC transporter substrate-binding protein n=1 Tax=Borborobacter arsenicus TaxID=1851146 RepID=A0A432VBW1_9HYPH|nr:ABC transporter substrate-binding protein [Pseudaminobacter arsenicus]RUM99616.1 hemin ABC transporter substrate-binding protein [Pseudaminobacter arsenicus]